MSRPETRADAGDPRDPPAPRMRLPLGTVEDVRRELARVYREARSGQRDVADASRLANILAIMARLIEGADLERRIAALESATPQAAPWGAGGNGARDRVQ